MYHSFSRGHSDIKGRAHCKACRNPPLYSHGGIVSAIDALRCVLGAELLDRRGIHLYLVVYDRSIWSARPRRGYRLAAWVLFRDVLHE